MGLLKVTKEQKRALAIATIAAVVVAVWFLKSYIMLIAVAAIIAYLFNPLYEWFLRHGRSKGQAATLTFLATLLAIIIPIIIVASITVLQINSLLNDFNPANYSADVGKLATDIINGINHFLTNIGISYQLTIEQVNETIKTAIEEFGANVASSIVSSVSSVFSFITIGIIYIYVFFALLVNKDKITKSLSKLNPLGSEISDLYFERMGSMTKATVRGQFIIALCQGVESAAVLAIAGLPNLFFFFALLLTIMSIIPLGAGIITIPIGIGMILTGNITGGVLVIANHLLIVTNIDNVLRPQLVPKEARLEPALMMLSVFSGLAIFGFVGIVLGPVLMILIVTTLQMFMEVYRNTESINHAEKTGPIRPLRKLFKKLKKQVS
jgi:predicted PurR-regulated permease PerM